jgi:hypothetical protein
MNDENRIWSSPDYDGWKKGIEEVGSLATIRFFFAVTNFSLVAIAYALIRHGECWRAGILIAVFILAFGAAAFLLQWRRDGDGKTIEESEVESKDQPEGK